MNYRSSVYISMVARYLIVIISITCKEEETQKLKIRHGRVSTLEIQSFQKT